MSDEQEINVKAIGDPKALRRTYWPSVAALVLGLAIGWFAGLSSSPVVGTLLPLLFGLFGGAGGFYFSKLDLSSPLGVALLRTSCIGLVLLCVGSISGSALGILLRAGPLTLDRPASNIVQRLSSSAPLSPSDLLELQLLVGRLHLLGVDDRSTESIVAGAIADLRVNETPVDKLIDIKKLRKEIEDVRAALARTAESDGATPDEVRRGQYELMVSRTLLDAIQKSGPDGIESRANAIWGVTSKVRDVLKSLNSPGLAIWRKTHSTDYELVAVLDSSVSILQTSVTRSPWRDQAVPATELKNFTNALLGVRASTVPNFSLADLQWTRPNQAP